MIVHNVSTIENIENSSTAYSEFTKPIIIQNINDIELVKSARAYNIHQVRYLKNILCEQEYKVSSFIDVKEI